MDDDASFSARQTVELRRWLALLVEADEPEAMLGALHRIAAWKALHAVNGAVTDRNEAERWYALASASAKVQREMRGDGS